MTLKEHEISHFDYTKYFFCYFVLGNIYALGGPENFGFINGFLTYQRPVLGQPTGSKKDMFFKTF